jgi:tetratricopeptide (TPR) repeat protein
MDPKLNTPGSFLFRRRKELLAVVILLNIILFSVHLYQQHTKVPPERRRADLARLLEATGSKTKALSADPKTFRYLTRDDDNPSWPVAAFLTAEMYRLRGDSGKARAWYKKLVLWAASDPYRDRSGGCGLAGVALWRWVQMLDASSSNRVEEAKHVLTVAPTILGTRQVSGIFTTSSTLAGLPQLEEDVRRRLASVAWRLGMKEDAANLFFSYLKVATTAGFTSEEGELFAYLVKERGVSPEKVALYRGERLVVLGKYEAAGIELAEAAKSRNPQVVAEASLNREKLRRVVYRDEKNKLKLCADNDAIMLLTPATQFSTDPDIAQEALSLLATIHVREGCGELYNQQGFRKTLTTLLKDYPKGKMADDAMNQLAKYYLYLYWQEGKESDFRESMRFYQTLADFKGSNEYRDSMRFMPAMAYYSRGGAANLRKAFALLQLLEKEQPFGPMHMQCLFWSGRIAEELNDSETARKFFVQAIKENPFDYYAIRARMHLNLGNKAWRQFDLDPKTFTELAALAKEGKGAEKELHQKSPYHLRLDDVTQSIYRTVVERYYQTRKKFSRKRLCDINVKALDDSNALIPVALLLAFREDVSIAAATPMEPSNTIDVSGCLEQRTRDWPVAMKVIFETDSHFKGKRALHLDPRYLATAYPPAFHRLLKDAAKRHNVSPQLLYSIIRNESAFNPAAWSDKGAIGLFQFLPDTFEKLDSEWHLLAESKIPSGHEYLLSPRTNITLGARWFRKLLDDNDGNVLFAIMEHNAGPDPLGNWRKMWKRVGRSNDYEFMVETTRYDETRRFERRILADYWTVNCVGLY